MINIQTRKQFDEMLDFLGTARIVVADTETNGLRHRREHCIISISIHLPEFNKTYNIPFRHGEGQINIRWGTKEAQPFDQLSWQGHAKNDLYLQYWFERSAETTDFCNLPLEWMAELKEVWGNATYIFHNARFDLHMLDAEGFPTPDTVLDTMLLLHILFEDWRRIGHNRRLKYMAKFWDIEDAEVGEAELLTAITAFEDQLTQYICHGNFDNNKNDGLRYAPYKRAVDIRDISPNHDYKTPQYDRIKNKIKLNPKAHMWMLPSPKIAYYAMLDVVLTWKLHEKLMVEIKKWDNVDLYHNLCDYALKVAWVMEKNGIKIDIEEAYRQMAIYEPRMKEIEELFPVNLNSPKALLPYLKEALSKPTEIIPPEWIDPAIVSKLDNMGIDASRLRATDKAALEPYRYHPIVALITEYKRLSKSAMTYLKKWISAKDAHDIVRGNMNADGTVTGRFSSSGDTGNYQNTPDKKGYYIKQVFVPYNDDWIIFALDYGQLEARIAAWIAETLLPDLGAYSLNPNVTTMTELFNTGVDMHVYTRDMIDIKSVVYPNMAYTEIATINGIDPLSMTPHDLVVYVDHKILRQTAKTLNFGLLYSGTWRMVDKELKVGEAIARRLVEQWRETFPAFERAQAYYTELGMKKRLIPDGSAVGRYITQPITGRHRKFHPYSRNKAFIKDGITQYFDQMLKAAEAGWNAMVQGLGGWMSVNAALKYQNEHTWEGIKLFAQIHDALDGNAHRNELHRVRTLMEYMVQYEVNPQLTVALEAGKNWQPYSTANPDGLREVVDIRKWIESAGYHGYKAN